MKLHRRFAVSDEVTTTGFYWSNILLSEGMNSREKSFLGKIQLMKTRDFWTQIMEQSHPFLPFTTGCPNDRCKLASAYTTAGSGFPPRLSLDKILSKPEEEHNSVSHKRSSADRSMTST
jgi:hypothetical protein